MVTPASRAHARGGEARLAPRLPARLARLEGSCNPPMSGPSRRCSGLSMTPSCASSPLCPNGPSAARGVAPCLPHAEGRALALYIQFTKDDLWCSPPAGSPWGSPCAAAELLRPPARCAQDSARSPFFSTRRSLSCFTIAGDALPSKPKG